MNSEQLKCVFYKATSKELSTTIEGCRLTDMRLRSVKDILKIRCLIKEELDLNESQEPYRDSFAVIPTGWQDMDPEEESP